MRISDWSSDVCSSDLHRKNLRSHAIGAAFVAAEIAQLDQRVGEARDRGPRHSRSRGYLRIAEPGIIRPKSRKHLQASVERGRKEGVGIRGGRSEEHTSELQSLMRLSYAVFCLKKKKMKHTKII